MIQIIEAKTKHDCTHLVGTFLDESHFDVVIDSDTDCYMPAICSIQARGDCEGNCAGCEKGRDELRIAFKIRKNWFTEEEQRQAYLGLREAATESQNRGVAAGPRGDMLAQTGRGGRDWVTPYEIEILEFLLKTNNDLGGVLGEETSIESIRKKFEKTPNANQEEVRGRVWLRSEVTKEYPEYHGWFEKWLNGLSNKPDEVKREEALRVFNDWISTTNYAKSVFSGVAGWYDRYPRIPYGRATAYTEQNPEKFALAYPFLQSLNRGFQELLPWRWANQKKAADQIDSRFLVPETVFTTVTVNKSFRTAAHFDAGDLNEGLSNLLVVGTGDYTGGYLVFPEYRIAVNVRPGDLLLVNNHEVLHGNTPIVLNNPDDPKCERISLVCYFREKMLELKDYDYELLRKQFVDERRHNKDHKFWRPLWNGVSPNNMWEEQEWFDYMKKHNIADPYAKPTFSTLESLFD